MKNEWQPTARPEHLRLRARLLRRVREYFAGQGVMEVETPVLSRAAVTDIHLHSLKTFVAGFGTYYLHTSPEYAMKRLLAAGSGDIYQIARVFRDAERGVLHNPEFTLVEWYRLGFDLHAMMDDTGRLLTELLGERLSSGPQWLSYQEAFLTHAGLDPLVAEASDLASCARHHGITAPPGPLGRDDWLDLLMGTLIGPRLGAHGLTFVYRYPASQAALARLTPGDPRTAERFEVYFKGIELANGFHELGDAEEQRQRFDNDLRERQARGLPAVPVDECLLAALRAGLPDCSGVAVGFDRVVMLAAGAGRIDEVMAFVTERS